MPIALKVGELAPFPSTCAFVAQKDLFEQSALLMDCGLISSRLFFFSQVTIDDIWIYCIREKRGFGVQFEITFGRDFLKISPLGRMFPL